VKKILNSLIGIITSVAEHAPWRVRAWVAECLQNWQPLKSGGIELVKNTEEELSEIRAFVAEIMRQSNSAACKRIAKQIEQDKIEVSKALGDKKADPSPLAFTAFATEAEALKRCATPVEGGRLLYGLVKTLQPMSVVEIGTAHGYGALYIGSALRDNGKGKLHTLEGMTARIEISRRAIQRFGLERAVDVVAGNFMETVPQYLYAARPLDLLFSDGNKDPKMTREQFAMALDVISSGYMFFDDINFSPEITELWQEIVSNQRISTCVTFHQRWGLVKVRPVSSSFLR
jgi:predicted O-methyltransferase YrrM